MHAYCGVEHALVLVVLCVMRLVSRLSACVSVLCILCSGVRIRVKTALFTLLEGMAKKLQRGILTGFVAQNQKKITSIESNALITNNQEHFLHAYWCMRETIRFTLNF